MEQDDTKQKGHRQRNAGRKAEKKKAKNPHKQELTDKQRNPKAFTFNSAIKAERRFRRKEDINTKKQHIPLVDRTPVEPPPILVAVVGPPKVGKTTLMQCLIKTYTRQKMTNMCGPVTVICSKKKRITFLECKNDINSMIDVAKIADLVLLLVDASFGFEMEMFEFLNICQVHGMPRIMGVLTHLDIIKNAKQLRTTKKVLKQRFWKEVFPGAKLMYLSGILHGEYLRNEIKNLSRFISVIKFRPLTWRTSHSYLLADRIEDLTDPEVVRQNKKTDRHISLYGYVRGVPLQKHSSVHIPGCGDLKIKDVAFLPDPCPFPDQLKKRALIERERHVYAPFSGVGGIICDKDAVYIELGGSHYHKEEEGGLVATLLESEKTLDEKLQQNELQLFSKAAPIKTQDIQDNFGGQFKVENVFESGRMRRKVLCANNLAGVSEEDIAEESSDEKIENSTLLEIVDNGKEELGTIKNADSDDDDDDYGGDEDVESSEDEDKEVENAKKRKQEDEDDDTVNKKMRLFDVKNDFNDDSSVCDVKDKNKKKSSKNVEVYHKPSQKSDDDVKLIIAEALSMLEETKKNDDSVDRDFSLHLKEEKGNDDYDNEDDDENEEEEDDEDDEDEDEDEDDVNDMEEKFERKEKKSNESGDEKEDEEMDVEEEEEEEEGEDGMEWKSNLAERAKDAFLRRKKNSQNLMKLVYGENNKISSHSKEEEEKEEDIVGGLFRVINEENRKKMQEKEKKNLEECVFPSSNLPMDWLDENMKVLIKDYFVTGKWKDSEDAEELLKLDDMDDDEYGDFEDLETGEKHEAKEKAKETEHPKEMTADEMDEKRKLIEKKRKLKEQFDAEYDDGEKTTYYDDLKAEAERQAQLNKSEFDNLDDDLRVQLEGFRAGMYVRIEIDDVPCELITNLDPSYPIVVGGLLPGEENISFVQARLKKHRWHGKILKTRDPLIISVGWRRFQTMPIYAKLEDNLRIRMLKYTPEHLACMAHFWGPVTPQGTGVLAVQYVDSRESGFRIAATGTIVEMDKSSKIVKKLKLTGVPHKIFKKTAFIKDMFNSPLEVARFEGAKIKTVSGIRGQIKKALSNDTMRERYPNGCFRATFEDKIQMSDIVFCRTWYRVEIPKFYAPVTNLLLPREQKEQWRGMRTVGELKHDLKIKIEPNKDSLYTPIERQEKVFKPLMIPKKLQKELPYRDKPKLQQPKDQLKKTFEEQRVAVVRDQQEEKIARLIKMIRTNYADKQTREKEAVHQRMTEYQQRVEEATNKTMKHQKRAKKEECRRKSKSKKSHD